MAIGYLIIQARTAHDALPLSGVQIQIMDDQGHSIYNMTNVCHIIKHFLFTGFHRTAASV